MDAPADADTDETDCLMTAATDCPKCEAMLRDGSPCRFAARQGGLCGVHGRAAGCEEECAVCLEPLARERRELACGHTFHRACLRAWFRRGSLTCPMCRTPCPEQAPLASRTLLGRVLLLGCGSLATLRAALAGAPWLRQRDYVVSLSYQSFTLDNFYEYLRGIRS